MDHIIYTQINIVLLVYLSIGKDRKSQKNAINQ